MLHKRRLWLRVFHCAQSTLAMQNLICAWLVTYTASCNMPSKEHFIEIIFQIGLLLNCPVTMPQGVKMPLGRNFSTLPWLAYTSSVPSLHSPMYLSTGSASRSCDGSHFLLFIFSLLVLLFSTLSLAALHFSKTLDD